MIRAVVLVSCTVAMLSANLSTSAADTRVALVIGNAAYEHTSPLTNPVNDANDVAGALTRLGFNVLSGIDLDHAAMRGLARRFARLLADADLALFYYAGHGVQVDGANYLAPIDATLNSATDLDFDTIRLELILRQMEREVETNVVFLDACRDNPMVENLAAAMGTRSVNVGRGLARVETGVGTFLAFATQPGNVALDGAGRNSPFTGALLRHIEQPGIDVSELMIGVRNDVLASTNGEQVPWEHSSLTGRVYLSDSEVDIASVAPDSASGALAEIAYWRSVDDRGELAGYESYLRRYPSGTFVELARLRIKQLTQAEVGAVLSQSPSDEPVAHREPVELRERADIRRVQGLLFELNYDPGPIDGVAGERTREAIRRYQDDNAITSDGVVTDHLLARLESAEPLSPWGTIVYSPGRQEWGMSWGHETRRASNIDAQSACGGSSDCEKSVSFSGRECAAFAHSSRGWAIGVAAVMEEAQTRALNQCAERGGSCQIVGKVCADGNDRQVAAQQ